MEEREDSALRKECYVAALANMFVLRTANGHRQTILSRRNMALLKECQRFRGSRIYKLTLLTECRNSRVPFSCLFKSVRECEHTPFVKMWPRNLQPDRKTLRGEAAGNGDRR